VSIEDAEHRLSFRFGALQSSSRIAGSTYTITRTVPANTWVLQEIDALAAYREAGWTLPAYQNAPYREQIEVDLRLVNLQLFVESSGAPGVAQGYFGPIVQDDIEPPVNQLIGEALDNPGAYYFRLGQYHERSRNYTRALEAYRQALDYLPGEPTIQDRIGQLCAQLPASGCGDDSAH
jgi:tetratricopeptide (TPR) repeat protein